MLQPDIALTCPSAVPRRSAHGHSIIRRGRLLAVLGTACALLIAGSTNAKPTFTTFGVFDVTGINASDTVTGNYGGGNSYVRTSDGVITQFHFPGAPQTSANSINDSGVIAGYYCDTGDCSTLGTIHGFVRAADGNFTAFDVRGASNTLGYSINNKGAVAGNYQDESGNLHGFVRAAGGRIRTFDPTNAVDTYAAAINDKGTVTGSYFDNADIHGFVYAADGTITTIDVPASHGTDATAINASGTVIGEYGGGDALDAFVRTSDGTIATFSYAGCNLFPMGINRRGVITGWCQEQDNPRHDFGFLRHPDGRFLLFHVPNGGATTVASGINDTGVIAGWYKAGGFLRFP